MGDDNAGQSSALAKGTEHSLTEGRETDVGKLAQMGMIVPLADPATVRAVAKRKAEVITALLDPEGDFLYQIPYQDARGKKREKLCTSKREAEEFAEKVGAEYRARPKRSGFEKIAEVLGLDAEPIEQRGVPVDVKADYSWVKYKATHVRSGRTAFGVGYCDKSEKGYLTNHAMLATADTRAYVRAIGRLAGYGDVGADEILAGVSEEDEVRLTLDRRQEMFPDAIDAAAPGDDDGLGLPPVTGDKVMTAANAWVQAFNDSQQAPSGKQNAKPARMQRALARRGDAVAAGQLGKAGLLWAGFAQDQDSQDQWEVEPPPITLDGEIKITDPQTTETKATEAETLPDTPAAKTEPEQPATISRDRAYVLTRAIARKFGAEDIKKATADQKSQMKAWLKEHGGVDRTFDLPVPKFDELMKQLEEEAASSTATSSAPGEAPSDSNAEGPADGAEQSSDG